MRYFIFLNAFLIQFSLLAQSYIPVPESDATWIQASYLYNMNSHEFSTLTIPLSFKNDTLINNVVYHQLEGHTIVEWVDNWGSQTDYATGMFTLQTETQLIFRQDIPAKKVYARVSNKDTLLYDFNLVVGQVYPETYTNLNYPNLKVMAKDSLMLMDGLYHDRWILGTNASDSAYVTIIEGVGANSGFSLPIWPLFEQFGKTLCLRVGENQIYDNWAENGTIIPAKQVDDCASNVSLEKKENRTKFHIFPNPSTGDLTIRTESSDEQIRIVTSIGQVIEIASKNEAGEYYIEGLKPGVYLVQSISNSNFSSQKIVVK